MLVSPNQLLRSLGNGALFLLVTRFLGKALLLLFLLVLASQLEPSAFLDLEVISSLFNFFVWLFLAATYSLARIGSAFPVGELDRRLKGLLDRTLIPALLVATLISAMIIGIGSFLDQVFGYQSSRLQLIVGLFALVQFAFSYLLGFHQARENYRLIGLCYLLPGLVALGAAGLFLFLDLGLETALSAYLVGAVAQLLLAYASLHRDLMRIQELPFTGIPKRITPGLVRISFGLVLFFVIYSMDIFSAKFLLDSASGEVYARLEFLGRIVFTIVATASFAFFVRIVRAYDDARLQVPELRPWPVFIIVILIVGGVALLPHLYGALFEIETVPDDLIPAMVMVVIAKIIQSFLFVVVTIKGATVSRFVLRWLGLVMIAQSLLFLMAHDSIDAIARNILFSGGFAVILFAISLFLERKRGTFR